MEWFFRPKVQLGLLVNFAFVMFMLVSSYAGERAARFRGRVVAVETGYSSVPPSPPPAPSRQSWAFTFNENGRTQVALYYDLTLVKRADFQLKLAPSFSYRMNSEGDLSNVTLRFIRFSDDEKCPGNCRLVINADDVRIWPSGKGRRTPPIQWMRETVEHSTEPSSNGRTVELMASEILTTHIPFDVFVQMIAAKRVTITLGADKAELTSDQIEELHDMYRKFAESKSNVVMIKID